MTELIVTGPAAPVARLVLAHGAGAPMTSPFMERIAVALAAHGIGVLRFELAYMAARRTGGRRRPPPRAETLVPEYRSVIESLPPGPVPFIGGKSMGGRIASLLASELHTRGAIAGLVCLGYPFHPSHNPQSLRTAHLETLACPALIVQGSADPLGSRGEVSGYRLSPAIEIVWIEGGDHDLAVPKRGRPAGPDGIEQAAGACAAFMLRRPGT